MRAVRLPGQPRTVLLLRTLAPALVVGVLGAQGLLNIADRDRAVAVWLLLGQSVPLALRSRFGLPVLVVTTAASGVQLLLGMPATNAKSRTGGGRCQRGFTDPLVALPSSVLPAGE
jgi:hypothetical protein